MAMAYAANCIKLSLSIYEKINVIYGGYSLFARTVYIERTQEKNVVAISYRKEFIITIQSP
jgi:hypothetical protein